MYTFTPSPMLSIYNITVKPLNTADLETGEKAAVIGVIYNMQNSYFGLENGRRYWEGGGIGRGVLRGTTVMT